jgi:hypothetical protein
MAATLLAAARLVLSGLERPAAADLDPGGLPLLGLGDPHLEDPTLELRLDGARVDPLGGVEGTRESP